MNSPSASRVEADKLPAINQAEGDEGVISESDLMIDESFEHIGENGNEPLPQQQPQQEKLLIDAKQTTDDPSKPRPETESDKQKTTKAKKKKSVEELVCPMRIIQGVLSKSLFKTANLSEIIEEKFYEADDYRDKIRDALADVRYLSTVEDLRDNFSMVTSVKPQGFQGVVNLEPSAFLSMNSIYDKPPKRVKSRAQKANKKKKNQNNNDNNVAEKHNDVKNKANSNPVTTDKAPKSQDKAQQPHEKRKFKGRVFHFRN